MIKNNDIMNATLGYISRNDRVAFPGTGYELFHPGLGNDVSTAFVSEDLVVSDIALSFLKDQNLLVDDTTAEELIISTDQTQSSSTVGTSGGSGSYDDPYSVTSKLTATLSVIDSADLTATIDSNILADIKSAVDYWAGAIGFPMGYNYKNLDIFVFIQDNFAYRSCENSRLSYTATIPSLQGIQISMLTSFPHIISIFLDRQLIDFWTTVRTETTRKRIEDYRDGSYKSNFYHIIRKEILKGLGIGPYWISNTCLKTHTQTSNITFTDPAYCWTGSNGVAAYQAYISSYNTSGIPFEYRSRKPSGGSSCSDNCIISGLEGGFLVNGGVHYDGVSKFYENSAVIGGLAEGEISQSSIYIHDTPLSRTHGYAVSGITLGVLKDMGWDVDYSKAEEYNGVYPYTP